MGLTDYDCEGVLTISSIVMNCSAWAVIGDGLGDSSLLALALGSDQRGEDRLLPNALGVIPYPRRETKTVHTLRIVVVGDVDETNSPYSDHTEGLIENVTYLETNLIRPVASATGVRAATLVLPGQASRSANIHVTSLKFARYGYGINAMAEGLLGISIPSGRFA